MISRDTGTPASGSASTNSKASGSSSSSTFKPASKARVQKNSITVVAYGHSGKAKLLTYDLQKLVRYGGILTIFTKGTIFTVDDGVIVEILKQFLIGAAICVGVHFGVEEIQSLEKTVDGLSSLSKYMNGFVPFVLGLYVSLALQRWWALRVQALGSIFDAIANVSMMIACILPGKEHRVIRQTAVKWGMASIQLLLKAARLNDDISDMEEKGLLSKQEVDAIQKCSPYGRAMVMWGWIMRICQDSFHKARGPPPHAPKVMGVFNNCISARNGIQTIHTYLQTQLPFAYVHLITLLVNVNNVIVTFKCALVILFSIKKEPMDIPQVGYQVLMMLLVPTLYQGLLSISYMIHDPFGEDLLDFPVGAYQDYVQESCNAVIHAQETFPSHLLAELQAAPESQKKEAAGTKNLDLSQDMSLLTESLKTIAGRLELLPRVAGQIETLQDMTSNSEKRRGDDAEKLRNLLGSLINQQGRLKPGENKVVERTGRALSNCVRCTADP